MEKQRGRILDGSKCIYDGECYVHIEDQGQRRVWRALAQVDAAQAKAALGSGRKLTLELADGRRGVMAIRVLRGTTGFAQFEGAGPFG